eukprot:jgi/Chrzof1/4830/Cz15g00270.t1
MVYCPEVSELMASYDGRLLCKVISCVWHVHFWGLFHLGCISFWFLCLIGYNATTIAWCTRSRMRLGCPSWQLHLEM